MTIDLNKFPYFDDFTPKKNFVKILFKPGNQVQVRELNQLQSIFKDQVSKFANHFFKNGSRVSDARANLVNYSYVKLANSPVFADIHTDGFIKNVAGTAVGKIVHKDKSTNTVYFSYRNATKFSAVDSLVFFDKDEVPLYTPQIPVGVDNSLDTSIKIGDDARLYTISEGVFFYNGLFIENEPSAVIVSKHGEMNDCKIGFDFVQSIVNSNKDSTLLDNCIGYSNLNAPGADRLVTELKLVKRSVNEEDGDNFIKLMTVVNGEVTFTKDSTEYSVFGDYLAKRTYEESGHYTLKPVTFNLKEHKKEFADDPNGEYLDGFNDRVIITTSPVHAYVAGYNIIAPQAQLTLHKARGTIKSKNVSCFADGGTYMLLKPAADTNVYPNSLTGSLVTSDIIDIKDATDVKIGECRISDVVKQSGITGVFGAIYKYILVDINLNTGKTVSQINSLVNVANNFSATKATAAPFNIENIGSTELIWQLNKYNVKAIDNISFTYRNKVTVTLDVDGKYVFTPGVGETFSPLNDKTTIGIMDSLPVDLTMASRFVITGGNITIDMGIANTGKQFTLIHDVVSTGNTSKTKTQTSYIHTTPAVNTRITLPHVDIKSLTKVMLSGPSGVTDITKHFNVNDGQTEYSYDYGYIEPVNEYSKHAFPLVGHTIEVHYDYYIHSGSGKFFDVNSYEDLTNPELQKEIPGFKTNLKTIDLSGAIDFRVSVLNSDPVIIADGTTITYDCEFYAGRIDSVCVDKDKKVFVLTGETSEYPIPAKHDPMTMKIAEVSLMPFTYSIRDVKIRKIDNKRYTMADIGRIDARVKNVEYYTALNLLEKSAADMKIKDSSGFDRFKNGFIADNFADFQACDLLSTEFKASVDRKVRELRPQFKARSRKFKLDTVNSKNFYAMGNMVLLDYTSVVADEQLFATKHISINPYYMYNKKGAMVLTPNVDTWVDESRTPKMEVDIDTGIEALQALGTATGVTGIVWGAWVDGNRTVMGSTSSQSSGETATGSTGGDVNGDGLADVVTSFAHTNTTTIDTTINVEQSREGVDYEIASRRDSYELGDRLIDIQLIPFMREQEIEFMAKGLPKHTKVYAFFDEVDVNEFCTLFHLNTTLGTQLITDANGECRGFFKIPAGRFYVGKKKFLLTGDPKNTGDPDLTMCYCAADYYAGGLDTTKQETTLNVATPIWTETDVTDARIDVRHEYASTTVIGAPSGQSTQFGQPPPPCVPQPARPPTLCPSTGTPLDSGFSGVTC